MISFLKRNSNKGFKGLIIRASIFAIFAIILSILSPILRSLFNFGYYKANTGYLSYLSIIFTFILLYARKEKVLKIHSYKNSIAETIIFSILAFIMFLVPIEFLKYNLHTSYIVANFIGSGLAYFFLILAVFGKNLILKTFQEETLYVILFTTIFYAIPLIFGDIWQIIFLPTKLGVKAGIHLIFEGSTIYNVANGFFVSIKDFEVIVGPACSGIQSITAFTFLYVISLFLLKKKREINIQKSILFFLLAIAVIYLLNTIRIIILLYVGAFISKSLAIELFHEYLSSVFFMILFVTYLYKVIPKCFKS